MALNVVVAPAGFKESLSADEVANCIEEGIRRVVPDANVRKAPMVDGGEGFAKILVRVTGGTLHEATVTGPVGQPVSAHYGILGGMGPPTAVIEMASAAGLRLVPEDMRDPLHTTTYGVGELIKAALDAGVERILIGCADSGTNDGGAGMAQALGVRLLDKDGQGIGWGGGELIRLHSIDLSRMDPRIPKVKFDVTCNFNSVLCDPNGTSRLFGPQKGATPLAVDSLVEALEHYAEVIRQQLKIDVRRIPGGGGAGGLGAGLRAFFNAELHHRYDIVMRYLDLDTPLQNADLVFTAEGCVDATTPRGKIPCEVGRRAKLLGHPVVALAGSIGAGAESVLEHDIDAVASIMDSPMSQTMAFVRAAELLKGGTERVMRAILVGRQLREKLTGAEDAVHQLMSGAAHESEGVGSSLPVEFLGALSEELRTPLNLIIAYSKMVKDGLLGTVMPDQQKALQQVIKNSYWVLMMLNGLLQSSGVPEKAAPLPIADALVSEVLPSTQSKYAMSS